MQKKKILSLAIATATVVTGLVGVTTATTPEVLDNGDLKICGTEYISDSNGSGGCITIQGKNVGATTTGAGPSALSTSYGYYFQWGDNNTGYTEQNWNSDNIQPDNAWGGGSDNNRLVYPVENGSERQGPCDTGYHVPSKGEWYALMDMWNGSNTVGMLFSNISQFYTDFQIPFAGYRTNSDGSLNGQGDYAKLWSSSPSVGYEGARYFSMYEDIASADDDYVNRAGGFPVRCFKDSALGSSSSEGGASTGQVTLTLTEGQNTCTLQDYNLGTHSVSQEDQEVQSENQEIVCEFLQNTGVIVTLSMSNLSAGEGETQKIGANNFTGIVLSGDYAGSIEDLIPGNYNLSGSHTIYTKEENKIGIWTGSLQIEGIIPAGTPSGSYTGALDIIIQAGA